MDSRDFRATVTELLRARHPLLLIETHEDDRVVEELAAIAADPALRTPRVVYEWSATRGLIRRGADGHQATKLPAAALEHLAKQDESALYVFRDLHAFLGSGGRPADPQVVRLLRDLASHFRYTTNPACIVIVAPVASLPPDLEKIVTIVDFPLPAEAEMRALLDGMIEMNRATGRVGIETSPDDLERLARAAAGLTLTEAENAFARALVSAGTLSSASIDVVIDEKRQTIRRSALLEFVATDLSLDDIGGLDNLKSWLVKREGAWLAVAKDWGLPDPKGVLIAGVPGCGKSLTAKCVAATWGLPLLRLDVGRVFSGLVGSSEQNMRAAIRTAEAIAPCVLWIDEIEKGFAGSSGSGDSGTGARVFGTFLTWLQDKAQPVFVIATANSIDRLPAEFLRKGRFDEIFFVDLPTAPERAEIWRLHLTKRYAATRAADGGVEIDDALCDDLATMSDGYSGAEIEQGVIAALFDAFADRRPLKRDDLARAITTMVPLAVTQAEQIARTRAWADARAVAASEPSGPETRGGRRIDFA